MVVLKGGEGAVMEASNGTLNQNVASYLKLAPPPPPGPSVAEDGSSSGGGGLSSGAIAGGQPLQEPGQGQDMVFLAPGVAAACALQSWVICTALL